MTELNIQAIQIEDEFDDADGTFDHYDAMPEEQRQQLRKQRHVDIRNFQSNGVYGEINMLYLDTFQISQLDPLTMSQLEAPHLLIPGESWSAGTVAQQTDRNNWWGITLVCSPGGNPNITQSIITG